MIFTKNLKTRVKMHMKELRRLISNTFRSFTPEDFQRTPGGLCIARGDTVRVHSSVDAFEEFQGKPIDIMAVLQGVVGDEGVVMMPTTAGCSTAGSFPLSGGYMRAGYLNWATKYFLDPLLLQHRLAR